MKFYQSILGGMRRGRGQRGRPGTMKPGSKQNAIKFDNDYDFEQANAEFQELESKLAKTKISKLIVSYCNVLKKLKSLSKLFFNKSGEPVVNGEEKKEVITETAPVENNEDEEINENAPCYDKAKSFFDNISCEALERSKG